MSLAALLDRLLPASLRDESDNHRRARILIACLGLLFCVSCGFLLQSFFLGIGTSRQSLALAGGAAFIVVNFLMLQRGASAVVVAQMVCFAMVLSVAFIARLGLGIHAPALRWMLLVPLLGGILVSTRFGFFLSALIGAILAWIYATPPREDALKLTPEAYAYLELVGNVSVAFAIAACAAIFESFRKHAVDEMERTASALRSQQLELEALRLESEVARATAEAELVIKNEFVEVMTRQAREQGMALEDTRIAMSGVTKETRKIGGSVKAFAEAAKASNEAAVKVDRLKDETQASIEEMGAAVEQNSASIEEMRMTLREVSKHVESLLQSVESTSSAMTELDASVAGVEHSTRDAAKLSNDVMRDAKHGSEVMTHSKAGMESIRESASESSALISVLGDRVSEIHAILDVIQNVSDRTNLLALNAAIIAAQAGEAGRGFAVVADQIKALADQTAGSTKQIETIVAGVQSQTRSVIAAMSNSDRTIAEGARLSEAAESALLQIVRSAEQSSTIIQKIAGATREQSTAISRVARDTERVTQTAQSVATTVREQVRTSEQIAQATERLGALAPKVQEASLEQAKGFARVRETMAKVESMIATLNEAQNEQTRQSERVLQAVESVHHTQLEQVRYVEKLQRGK